MELFFLVVQKDVAAVAVRLHLDAGPPGPRRGLARLRLHRPPAPEPPPGAALFTHLPPLLPHPHTALFGNRLVFLKKKKEHSGRLLML